MLPNFDLYERTPGGLFVPVDVEARVRQGAALHGTTVAVSRFDGPVDLEQLARLVDEHLAPPPPVPVCVFDFDVLAGYVDGREALRRYRATPHGQTRARRRRRAARRS